MFDRLEAANINVVYFQVRPFADAFYRSAYEPWSHLLGSSLASRGVFPGYDPLALAIDEAHKRGMELHVWLNPYRFESTAGDFAGRPGNYAQTHPHLIINYLNRTYFDPGHPETTKLIKNIVADIAHNYNIDGVIFDDYFYPSNMPSSFDQHTFNAFGNEAFIRRYYDGPLFATLTRGDFRRASVNNMIREVNDTLKSINPALLFGVSPAGIYTTNNLVAQYYGTTLPPGITGNNNWATINCDPLAWLREGSVDYISPQLYWPIGGSQDFIILTQWWGEQARRYGRHHYPSLGSYRLYGTKSTDQQVSMFSNDCPEYEIMQEEIIFDKSLWEVSEIGNQIIANRNSPNNTADGIIFYNTNSLLNTSKNLAGFLRQDLYAKKTILPVLPWLPAPDLKKPQIADLGIIADDASLAVLNINSTADRFLLFGMIEPPAAKNQSPNVEFLQVAFGRKFTKTRLSNFPYLAISEYARNKTVGELSDFVNLIPIQIPVVSTFNGALVCEATEIKWNDLPEIDNYSVLLFDGLSSASGMMFETPATKQPWFTINSQWFEGQKTYFYRVKASNKQVASYSLTDHFFTGFPSTPVVNHPANGQQNTGFTTVAQWQHLPEATSYHLQVSLNPEFDQNSIVIDRSDIGQNISNITLAAGNTVHYLRVAGRNTCGTGQWSPVVSFTTTSGVFVPEQSAISLKAYPNPADSRFFLPYPQNPGKRTIELYNASGQKIWHLERNDDTRLDELELEGLPAGFYTGIVRTKNGKFMSFKIIKTNR